MSVTRTPGGDAPYREAADVCVRGRVRAHQIRCMQRSLSLAGATGVRLAQFCHRLITRFRQRNKLYPVAARTTWLGPAPTLASYPLCFQAEQSTGLSVFKWMKGEDCLYGLSPKSALITVEPLENAVVEVCKPQEGECQLSRCAGQIIDDIN